MKAKYLKRKLMKLTNSISKKEWEQNPRLREIVIKLEKEISKLMMPNRVSIESIGGVK